MHGRPPIAKIFHRPRTALPARKADKPWSLHSPNPHPPLRPQAGWPTLRRSRLMLAAFAAITSAFSDCRRLID